GVMWTSPSRWKANRPNSCSRRACQHSSVDMARGGVSFTATSTAGTIGPPRISPSERDVAVLAASGRGLGQGGGDGRPGPRRLEDLVDDPDVHGALQPAGEPVVLVGELLLDLRPLGLVDLGQAAPVEDTDRGDRPHDGDVGLRPGEDLRRAEGT